MKRIQIYAFLLSAVLFGYSAQAADSSGGTDGTTVETSYKEDKKGFCLLSCGNQYKSALDECNEKYNDAIEDCADIKSKCEEIESGERPVFVDMTSPNSKLPSKLVQTIGTDVIAATLQCMQEYLSCSQDAQNELESCSGTAETYYNSCAGLCE